MLVVCLCSRIHGSCYPCALFVFWSWRVPEGHWQDFILSVACSFICDKCNEKWWFSFVIKVLKYLPLIWHWIYQKVYHWDGVGQQVQTSDHKCSSFSFWAAHFYLASVDAVLPVLELTTFSSVSSVTPAEHQAFPRCSILVQVAHALQIHLLLGAVFHV